MRSKGLYNLINHSLIFNLSGVTERGALEFYDFMLNGRDITDLHRTEHALMR